MDHSKRNPSTTAATERAAPFYAPGSGLTPRAADGGKFLSYDDLRAQKPRYPDRQATREIELRLTGSMERYIWSINGVKYADAEPIRLKYGERVRFKFVNETMMRSEEHTSELQSLMRISYAVFCLKQKNQQTN